jgi:hypothetical protein
MSNLRFRLLRRIVDAPVLLKNGSVLTVPGYHEASGLYYAPQPGFNVPTIPENPTAEDIERARRWIEEILCDFPFKDESSRTNFIALLLTPLVRELVPTVPLALINAPEAGTGKTLLASLLDKVVTGTPRYQAPALSQGDEELRKAITSVLKTEHSIFAFDNVEGVLKSPVLAATLTTPQWSDRILGSNKIFQGEQRLTWMATGNNILLGGDMKRRSYEISLDARIERPWLRYGFRHPNLENWIHENRGQLVGALLILIRAWIAVGRPAWTDVVLGSFEQWAGTVGGILANAGYQGFLANLSSTYDRTASDESEDWAAFFEAIRLYKQGEVFTTKNISEVILSEEHNSLRDTLPSSLRYSLQKNSQNLTTALGSFFQRNQGRWFKNGESLYCLERSSALVNGVRLWSFHQK